MLSSRLFQSLAVLTKKEFLYRSDLAYGTVTLLLLIRDCLVTIFVEMQLPSFFGLICLFPSYPRSLYPLYYNPAGILQRTHTDTENIK
jgi:hypothetical protein